MTRLMVAVEEDHLERLIKRPIGGLGELLWNAVDADATAIAADVVLNELGGVDAVEVRDDGTGISREQADMYFSHLGGSWKKFATMTEGGRTLHGQAGQGRWAAYGLGEVVRWTSMARQVTGGIAETRIIGRRQSLNAFEIEGPFPATESAHTGTTVRVEQLDEAACEALGDYDGIVSQLTTTFALTLEQCPLTITWRGRRLDPASVQRRRHQVTLDVEEVTGTVQLVVIEWAKPQKNRLLHLCDGGGASLHAVRAGIHAPGFDFTAYLRWDGFRDRAADLALADLGLKPVSSLVEAAKNELRRYFGERAQQRGLELVAAWKADRSYPYPAPPRSSIEAAEREVFDVAAVAAAPAVENIETRARKLSLRLLREALESNPGSLHVVLREVLDLPENQVDELRELLDKTSLGSVIAASRHITDRLDFLLGLEELIFGEPRKKLLERSQLHRILAGETWVFREEYALTADDVTLRTALADHIGLLGREGLVPEDVTGGGDVVDTSGARVVVDLMLSRIVPQTRANREHIVIEIKRPTVPVGIDQLMQIQRYALAVAQDGRFAMTDTRWEFWVVGDRLDPSTDLLLRQRDREPGVFVAPGEHNVTVRAVTWAQVLQDARHRLGFVRDSLAYNSTTDASMAYLRRVHGKYLPARPPRAGVGDTADAGPASAAEEDAPEAQAA